MIQSGAEVLRISAPGRICLFGEHQDYLALPVIAAAISLRLQITGRPLTAPEFRIALPDIAGGETVAASGGQRYTRPRDYFRSGVNVLWKAGVRWRHGWQCEVRSQIPINAGTSSSSALMVAWITFLLAAADDPRSTDAAFVAEMAYRAEVLEFNEPGGMMDQYTSSYGGLIFLDFSEQKLERLPQIPGTFVLGNSLQPKDTHGKLADVKSLALQAVDQVSQYFPEFDLRETPVDAVRELLPSLPDRLAEVLLANLIDRDLLREAYKLLHVQPFDPRRFGALLTQHHEQLARHKRVSTPKLDRMLESAIAAGAYGGKLNGSGGGGCMFAYAPENPEAVAEAIRQAGGKADIVTIGGGCCYLSR